MGGTNQFFMEMHLLSGSAPASEAAGSRASSIHGGAGRSEAVAEGVRRSSRSACVTYHRKRATRRAAFAVSQKNKLEVAPCAATVGAPYRYSRSPSGRKHLPSALSLMPRR